MNAMVKIYMREMAAICTDAMVTIYTDEMVTRSTRKGWSSTRGKNRHPDMT